MTEHVHFLNFSSECENSPDSYVCASCDVRNSGVRWNFTLNSCATKEPYSGAFCHSCFVKVSGPINAMLKGNPSNERDN